MRTCIKDIKRLVCCVDSELLALVRSLVTMIGEGPMSTPLAVTNARRVLRTFEGLDSVGPQFTMVYVCLCDVYVGPPLENCSFSDFAGRHSHIQSSGCQEYLGMWS